MMILGVGGLLQTWLLVGICGSLAADDVFLDPDADYSQFVPLDTIGGGTAMALGSESGSLIADNLETDFFTQADPVAFLNPDGADSASDLFATIDSSDGFLTDDASSLDLIANSGAGCMSYEGQPISRIRRDTFCTDPSLLETPSTNEKQPTKDSGTTFPPPGSNPGRLPGKQNDPKPRTGYDGNALNTDEDFQICPSGTNGYRQYAVCDSGIKEDRYWQGYPGIYALYHCSRRKQIS